MNVLLTYDIKKTSDTIHRDLKERLINNYGYSDQILAGNNSWYSLPNTTLRKSNVTSQIASGEFIQACIDVGAKWEKYIAAEYSTATFNNQQ